jgi:hemerythrin-like metal-binding protein
VEYASLHGFTRTADRRAKPLRPLQDPSACPCEERRRQLQDIFEALDAAIALAREEAPAEALGRALDELQDCTREHFDAQERWLGLQEHSWHDTHRETHQAILAHLAALRKGLARLDAGQVERHLRFMDRWLTTHAAEEAVRLLPQCR